MSSSVHEEAANTKEVFKACPELGETRKDPGTGAPLVRMSIEEEEDAPETSTHVSVNVKVDRAGSENDDKEK